MSETKRFGDVEWLARCLSDQLATEPPDDGSVDATEGKVPDRNWAQLLGAAAVPVDEADLRI